MKKLILSLALACASIGAAQAQVYFDSGSARPNNPGAARHGVVVERAAYRPHGRDRFVRCRDGARRASPRMCRGHGGVWHR